MKRLLLIFAALVHCQAAITYVQGRMDISAQNVSGPTSSTTVTLPFSSSVTSGNFIFVTVGCNDCLGSTATATDTLSSTYSLLTSRTHSTVDLKSFAFCGVVSSTGANTVTVTASAAATWWVIGVAEYSGLGSCTPDGTASGDGANLTPVTSSAIVTTNANTVVVCGVQYWASVTTPTPGAGYTQRLATASADSAMLQDQIVTSTGSFTCDSTFTTASNNNWVLLGAALQTPSAPGPHRIRGTAIMRGQDVLR